MAHLNFREEGKLPRLGPMLGCFISFASLFSFLRSWSFSNDDGWTRHCCFSENFSGFLLASAAATVEIVAAAAVDAAVFEASFWATMSFGGTELFIIQRAYSEHGVWTSSSCSSSLNSSTSAFHFFFTIYFNVRYQRHRNNNQKIIPAAV